MAAIIPKTTLYWSPICPFVQIATIALHEKGINTPETEKAFNIERVEISLSEDAPEFYKKINPKETVPTLTVAGNKRSIFESLLIAEYFDETYGVKNTLLPPAPELRASIRAFQDVASGFIRTGYGVMYSEEAKRAAAIEESKAATKKLEEAFATRKAAGLGPYFLGSDFTLADAKIVPFLLRFQPILRAKFGYDVLADAPQLLKLREASRSRPSVIATSLTDAEYIKFYADYGTDAKPVATPKAKITTNRASAFAARVELGATLVDATVEVAVDAVAAQPTVEFLGASARGNTNALRLLQDTAAPALLPTDPAEANAAKFVAGEADEFAGVLAGALKAAASADDKAQLKTAAKYIETLVDGPFVLGGEPTLADAALAPIVYFAQKTAPESLAEAPKLRGLIEKVSQKPAAKAVLEAIDVTTEGQKRFVIAA